MERVRGLIGSSRGAARLGEHRARVAVGEHGLFQPRLHDLALDAEEVLRPRPRRDARELIQRDASFGWSR